MRSTVFLGCEIKCIFFTDFNSQSSKSNKFLLSQEANSEWATARLDKCQMNLMLGNMYIFIENGLRK